jgi:hypothetical protein
MRYLAILIGMVVLALRSFAQQPVQTPAQIQQQKTLADQMQITGAPSGFITPFKTFETYFNAFAKADASEFACLTANAIKEWFSTDALSSDDLQRIRLSRQIEDEKDFTLIEFRYAADPNKPRIKFGWSSSGKDNSGQRITQYNRQELTFVRTADGLKIDLVDGQPTP